MFRRYIKSKTNFILLPIMVLGYVVLLGVASWWSSISNNLILEEISISNTKFIEKNEFYELASEFLWKPLEDVDLTSICKIIEEHPYVEAARISKWYPSKIKIELIEREPIAILNVEPMILLDKNSFVLPNKIIKSNYNLPILNNFNTNLNLYPSGQKVLSENVENSVKWLQKIKIEYPSLYSDISEMTMTSNNQLNIILSEYPTSIFLGKDQIWVKIEILKKFEIGLLPKKLSDFKYIDMRYNNQVIAKKRIL
tara:strand:+ start:3359 stop:4120 length:762 start_codon:yes stop_codon:yes gene_type:complete